MVSAFRATPRAVWFWGRRRFRVEGFFQVMKGELSFGSFGQRTALGVHRFLFLSLLAYLLPRWVRVERLGGGGASWRESGGRSVGFSLSWCGWRFMCSWPGLVRRGGRGSFGSLLPSRMDVYAGYAGGARNELKKQTLLYANKLFLPLLFLQPHPNPKVLLVKTFVSICAD